ncbi:hypothetical protein LOAG_10130, partial [Loa loa]
MPKYPEAAIIVSERAEVQGENRPFFRKTAKIFDISSTEIFKVELNEMKKRHYLYIHIS